MPKYLIHEDNQAVKTSKQPELHPEVIAGAEIKLSAAENCKHRVNLLLQMEPLQILHLV